MNDQQPLEPRASESASEYKPNVYQLIFWGLTYGVIAGVVLLVLRLLANYLSLLWGPVFLAALAWGGYRNYLKQRQEWYQSRGVGAPVLSTMDQIKAAARDIVTASQELARQEEEDQILANQAAQDQPAPPVITQEEPTTSEQQTSQTPPPPVPPTPPATPT